MDSENKPQPAAGDKTMKVRYEVGDTVKYTTFTGMQRVAVVTRRHGNIKNNRPGFEATTIDPVPEYGWDARVWGYDDDVTEVVSVFAEETGSISPMAIGAFWLAGIVWFIIHLAASGIGQTLMQGVR